jgi:ABC-2 type transport system permease protein
MTLLRLEILRVVRTRRWMLVVGVYAFFGLAGPLLARYLNEILERFGGDEIIVAGHDPQPIDGIV